MHIVFTIKNATICGGIERVTLLVANELAERGHRVSLVSFLGHGETPFFAIHHNIQLYCLSGKKDKNIAIYRDIRRMHLLHRLYVQLQPDVIILSGTFRSLINIPAARGFKTIFWEHASTNYHRYHPIDRLSRRIVAHFSDTVVTLTQADANVYRNTYGAKHVAVIPNALTIVPKGVSTLENKVILAVGRLAPVKLFDRLLTMWHGMEHEGWRLRIVGSGSLESALKEQIVQHQIQDVEMIPQTNDVATEYQKASIFVMSSKLESFGLVLLEAMSVGLPIVSLDCGDGPREIIADGVTGMIVPTMDFQALSKALHELMCDTAKRKQMGAAALQRIQQYELPAIVDKWEQLLGVT